jgi:phosphopantothenoylcysteine decarboxylase / phosphopantothenate---cysteine ligase
MAAAVTDWRAEQGDGRCLARARREPGHPLARHKQRPRLVVGFAAETENLLANAAEKLKRKGADFIVANDVSPETGIMGGTRNRVHLISAEGVEDWPEMSKEDVAARLATRIAEHLSRP